MLELDVLLTRFFDRHYLTLPTPVQQQFEQLLECTDQELFNWLMGKEPPAAEYAQLVEKIRHH